MSTVQKSNDGGPAFPTPAGHAKLKGYQPGQGEYETTVPICTTGMSTRLVIAKDLLAGHLASEGFGHFADTKSGHADFTRAMRLDVQKAIQYADELMRQLEG